MKKNVRNIVLLIVIIILIAGGITLLAYPFITNLIGSRQSAEQLSEWEEAIEKQEQPGGETDEPLEGSREEEEAIIEWSEDISKQAEPHKELDAEEYFPLKITIPAVDVEWIVNEGTDKETLYKGPGHIIGTPFPGEEGRCTISGHRTTYGAPFNRVDELVEDDFIYLETIKGETFIYAVTGQEIVRPKDVHILEGDSRKELLLTACHPKYSAEYRIIIIAELVNIYDTGIPEYEEE